MTLGGPGSTASMPHRCCYSAMPLSLMWRLGRPARPGPGRPALTRSPLVPCALLASPVPPAPAGGTGSAPASARIGGSAGVAGLRLVVRNEADVDGGAPGADHPVTINLSKRP
jgi:hypothetical protein